MIATVLSWIAGKWLFAKTLPAVAGQAIVEKKGLILQYFMIGALIVLMVLASNLWARWQLTQQDLVKTKSVLDSTNERLTHVETINQTQDQTIVSLKSDLERNNSTVQLLSDENIKLDTKVKKSETRLSQMEKNNAKLTESLDGYRLPDELKCLFNPKSCTKPAAN